MFRSSSAKCFDFLKFNILRVRPRVALWCVKQHLKTFRAPFAHAQALALGWARFWDNKLALRYSSVSPACQIFLSSRCNLSQSFRLISINRMWLVARRRTRYGIEGDGGVFYFLKWKKIPLVVSFWRNKTRTIWTEKSSGFFGFLFCLKREGEEKIKSNSKFFIADENSQGFPPFSLISSCQRRRTYIFLRLSFFFFESQKTQETDESEWCETETTYLYILSAISVDFFSARQTCW